MSLASPRSLFLLAFLGCLALLGGALYLEHGVGLDPCPLCIVQRIFVILFGLGVVTTGYAQSHWEQKQSDQSPSLFRSL